MKISVRSDVRFSLVLPVRLALWMVGKASKAHAPEVAAFLRRENRGEMRKILRAARRIHGRLELVRVEASDGTRVRIAL